MRIGFDAKRLFNNHTGLGNYARRLIAALVTFVPEMQPVLFTPRIHPHFKDLFGTSRIILPGPFSPLWRQLGIQKAIRLSGIELYHGLSAELPLRIPRGVKTVVTVHDVLYRRFPDYYPFTDRLFYHYKMKRCLKRADAIVAISEATARDLQLYYKIPRSKVEVIPVICSVPETQQHRSEFREQTEPFILCVSRFEKRKNHLNLLRAYCAMDVPQRPALVLVGPPGDSLSTINRFIDEHGLSESVTIRHQIGDEELAALYGSCSLFVYPSLYEGFGMPVAEAMWHGALVCTGRDTSMSEITGSYGFLFDPRDVSDMAQAITSALQPHSAMGKTPLLASRLQLLSAEYISARYADLYRSVLKA